MSAKNNTRNQFTIKINANCIIIKLRVLRIWLNTPRNSEELNITYNPNEYKALDICTLFSIKMKVWICVLVISWNQTFLWVGKNAKIF